MTLFISISDAQAYGSYCWYCGHVGVRPMQLNWWLALTETSVKMHWESFAFELTRNTSDNIRVGAPHCLPIGRPRQS